MLIKAIAYHECFYIYEVMAHNNEWNHSMESSLLLYLFLQMKNENIAMLDNLPKFSYLENGKDRI